MTKKTILSFIIWVIITIMLFCISVYKITNAEVTIACIWFLLVIFCTIRTSFLLCKLILEDIYSEANKESVNLIKEAKANNKETYNLYKTRAVSGVGEELFTIITTDGKVIGHIIKEQDAVKICELLNKNS